MPLGLTGAEMGEAELLPNYRCDFMAAALAVDMADCVHSTPGYKLGIRNPRYAS